MKPLPEINLKERYKKEFDCSKYDYYKYNLKKLIKKIEREDNPVDFMNKFLAIIQLYLDGLIQKGNPWPEQKKILDNLYLAGKKSVGSFYRGKSININEIKEIFLPSASQIIKYGDKKSAKGRHLSRSNYFLKTQTFGLRLQDILNENSFHSLICIASGGFEPSFLAMDIAEKDSLIAVRYSGKDRKDSKIKIPKEASEDYIFPKVRNKKVLVIEDWIASGNTLATVMRYVAQMNPSELYGTSVINYNTVLSGFETIKEGEPFVCKY